MVWVLTCALLPHLASDEDITPRVDTSEPWKGLLMATMRECIECLPGLLHAADSQNILGLHLLPSIISRIGARQSKVISYGR